MKFTAISSFLLVSFAFSNGALGYASHHLHRRALAPRASNMPRSPEIINLNIAPYPTAVAVLPRQDNPNAPKIDKQLTLTANTTTVLVSSTSKASAPNSSAASIGGIARPNIENTKDPDRPFSVNGNTFTDIEDAVDRACAIQHNKCADAINKGGLSDVEVSDCDDQQATCIAAGTS